MALNAVQFDMLCLENSLMKHGKRTWIRHSRHKECELLENRFGRKIGKSWLDDNRGALKKGGYHKSWQHGFQEKDGVFNGSESRRQFTYKACVALSRRGIKVFRRVWHALKKGFTPPKPCTWREHREKLAGAYSEGDMNKVRRIQREWSVFLDATPPGM